MSLAFALVRLAVAAAAAVHLGQSVSEAGCGVGVEVRTGSDETRRYGAEARPVRIFVWYPATAPTSSAVTTRSLVRADWLSSAQATPGWSDWPEARRRFAAHLAEMRSTTPAQHAMTARGCAGWLAPPRPGRWPLVLIGSGLAGRATDHMTLAEVLADAGFVVAFVSVLGPQAGTSPSFDTHTVRMLADDAARALRTLGDDTRVDATRIGLVSWSLSGIVHLALGQQLSGVRAAVSLDSGVGYNYGPPLFDTLDGLLLSSPRRYLHLRAGVRSPVATDDELLRRLGAEVEVVQGLAHAQFTDVPSNVPRVQEAQDAMRRRVREFLLTHVTP